MTGPRGVVLVGYRRAKQSHNPVAAELTYRALILVNFVQEEPETPVYEPVNFFRIKLLRDRSIVDDICEEDSDKLSLPFDSPSVVDDFFSKELWCVRPRMCVIND